MDADGNPWNENLPNFQKVDDHVHRVLSLRTTDSKVSRSVGLRRSWICAISASTRRPTSRKLSQT
jgi:hypothetical protein